MYGTIGLGCSGRTRNLSELTSWLSGMNHEPLLSDSRLPDTNQRFTSGTNPREQSTFNELVLPESCAGQA